MTLLVQAGKNLKPYQGLKLYIQLRRFQLASRKKPKTLSGIETSRSPCQQTGTAVRAGKNLKPYQGLKPSARYYSLRPYKKPEKTYFPIRD